MKMVSVWMISYNHQDYIEKAILGVINQKTDFEHELVISDDASTDRTPGIIKKFQKKHPKIVKAYLHRQNRGMTWNVRFTINKCGGKYVAMCEGDDYWTNPRKLQKQVDYLEANPTCSITAHNVEVVSNTNKSLWWTKPFKPDIDIEHLLKYGSGGPTCSLVFRNHLFTYPKWYRGHLAGDWLTQILCAQHGYMHRFDDGMGVYRKHSSGSVHATTLIESRNQTQDLLGLPQKYTLKFVDLLDKHFKLKYHRLLNYHRASNLFDLAKVYFYNQDYQKAKSFLLQSFKLGFIEVGTLTKEDVALLALLLLPSRLTSQIIRTKRYLYQPL